MVLHKNGFIIKSMNDHITCENGYRGIELGTTWPLAGLQDSVSKALDYEAEERWLGYNDDRPRAVPDLSYIKRYWERCVGLGMEVACFQIESNNILVHTDETAEILSVLGYEYVDANLQTSILYEDLFSNIGMEPDEVLKPFRARLNSNGLFDQIEDINKYVEVVRSLDHSFPEYEEYACPMIIRFTHIKV